MRVVVQRVRNASVQVDGQVVGKIGYGYLLLVGLAQGDDLRTVERLADAVAKARLLPDTEGKLGITLRDAQGEALAVSQFTLLADFSKGNRPSFHGAAKPEQARPLFDHFVQSLAERLGKPVATGTFGADMQVALTNDGPMTVVFE